MIPEVALSNVREGRGEEDRAAFGGRGEGS